MGSTPEKNQDNNRTWWYLMQIDMIISHTHVVLVTLVKFNFFAPNTAEPMPTEYSWQFLSYVTLNWRHWDSKVRHLKFTWSSGSAHAKLVKFIPLSHHQQFTHEPMVNPCFHVILANYYDAHTWFIIILFLMFLSLSLLAWLKWFINIYICITL